MKDSGYYKFGLCADIQPSSVSFADTFPRIMGEGLVQIASFAYQIQKIKTNKYLKKTADFSAVFFACMREDLIKCGKALLAFFESGVVCDDVIRGGEAFIIAPMHIEPEIIL